MAYRKVPFAVGEWFHCYTRTIDHSRPFVQSDFLERFLELLYLSNQKTYTPNIAVLRRTRLHAEMFSRSRHEPLVSIGAYCVMPTHYHLLVRPVAEGGLSSFMQRVGTGITKYYNETHSRVGSLFISPFRAKHVGDDRYFRRVADYIHLNPVELVAPDWKKRKVTNIHAVAKSVNAYKTSSLMDYIGSPRPQRSLLDPDAMDLIGSRMPATEESLKEASEYYAFLEFDMGGHITPRSKIR